jgi:microcystin-dependent protein
MANPFLAEIRIFTCNFAPAGWAFCNGQLLPISQNTPLFSLLGTNYGGDGKTTFALPDLRGSVPMFYGQGPGLSSHDIGEAGGAPTVTLLNTEVPAHAHNLQASPHLADIDTPGPGNSLGRSAPQLIYKTPNGAATPAAMAPGVVTPAGSTLPHNNLMPYLTLNFCIALQGVYPPRT